jgi:hypothetical protein
MLFTVKRVPMNASYKAVGEYYYPWKHIHAGVVPMLVISQALTFRSDGPSMRRAIHHAVLSFMPIDENLELT